MPAQALYGQLKPSPGPTGKLLPGPGIRAK